MHKNNRPTLSRFTQPRTGSKCGLLRFLWRKTVHRCSECCICMRKALALKYVFLQLSGWAWRCKRSNAKQKTSWEMLLNAIPFCINDAQQAHASLSEILAQKNVTESVKSTTLSLSFSLSLSLSLSHSHFLSLSFSVQFVICSTYHAQNLRQRQLFCSLLRTGRQETELSY